MIDVLEAGGCVIVPHTRPDMTTLLVRRRSDSCPRSQATEANVHLAKNWKQQKCKAPQQKEAGVVPKNTITSAHDDEGEGADGPITKE